MSDPLKRVLKGAILPTFLVGAMLFWQPLLWAGQGASAPATARQSHKLVIPPSPPRFDSTLIPEGTIIEVRLDQTLSSEDQKTGDTFEALLDRDISAEGTIAIPHGSRVVGKLLSVQDAGKVKGRARMVLQLDKVYINDHPYPLETNTITIEAEGSKGHDSKTIGALAGLGAIIGAIAGGGKGAALGGLIGGGTATAGVLLTKGKAVKLEKEQLFSFRLDKDVRIDRR